MTFPRLQSAICAILADSGENRNSGHVRARPGRNSDIAVLLYGTYSMFGIVLLYARFARLWRQLLTPTLQLFCHVRKFERNFHRNFDLAMTGGCHYIHSPGLLLGVLVKGNRARDVIRQGVHAWVVL